MKRQEILVGKYKFLLRETNVERDVARALLDPKRHRFKRKRFDHKPLFKRGSRAHLSTQLA